ncbi:Metallo-hydrolase/oxidoreductase [Hortaea werneckii]|nr:Metallo-hydrolase/oxidoreductase [Hortaea werneckii]
MLGFFIVARDDSTSGLAFLVGCRLATAVVSLLSNISCNSTHIFNDMAVIANEQKRSAVGQVDLHSDETLCMTRKVMQRDPLTEVHGPFIKCLPVQVQLEVVFEVHPNVSSRSDGPERRTQLNIMNPDLDILAIKEEVETSSMVQVKMTDDNRLYILKLVASSLDRCIQLMVRFVTHSREDVCHLRSPDFRIVLAGSKLPQNTAFMRMLDQYCVHGQMTTLVDERLVFRAHERRVASS